MMSPAIPLAQRLLSAQRQEGTSPVGSSTAAKRSRPLDDFLARELSRQNPSKPAIVATVPTVDLAEQTAASKRLKQAPFDPDYTQRPDRGLFKRAHASDGKTLYFPFSRLRMHDRRRQAKLKTNTGSGDRLLQTSVYRLMDQIETEAKAKAMEASMEDFQARLEAANKEQGVRTMGSATQLWVDKYRPQSYMDLLTDEWVKQWDQCVFGRKTNVFQKKSKTRMGKENVSVPQDRLGRPDNKILMLTGPPGLGKTTLAHIVGKTAGYNIIEVNASDERTADVVQNKILSAIEMQPVFGDRKPNMIIIDEIDGAMGGHGDGAFVKMLVDLATAESHPPQGNHQSFQTKRKKKQPTKSLMRPIICICNDQYAPALRPLRAIAQVYHIRKPTASVLSKRLRIVCDHEKLKIDMRALTTLCEKADGDIRACLNTLQFLKNKIKAQQSELAHFDERATPAWKRKKREMVTVDMVKNLSFGQKDLQKSVFSVWAEIFQLPTQQRLDSARLVSVADRSEDKQRVNGNDHIMSLILPAVQACGEYDKLMNGCFEMYPTMKFRDVGGCGINMVNLHEHIAFFDRCMSAIYGNSRGGGGASEGMAYLPFGLLAFNRFCAQPSKPEGIEFPRQESEFRATHRKNETVLKDVFYQMDAMQHTTIGSANVFCLQYLSPLMRIMSPVFRSNNPQLMKPKELEVLVRLARTMYLFRLTYRQEKQESGQYHCVLEPPMDTLLVYSTLNEHKSILPAVSSVRQMIAHEVETVRIEAFYKHSRNDKSGTPSSSQSQSAAPYVKRTAVKRDMDLSNLMAGRANLIKKKLETKAPKDYFKNLFDKAKKGEDGKENEEINAQEPPEPPKKPHITYKFFEGSSNAVRRPVFMSSLVEFMKH